MGEMINGYKRFAGNPEEKRPLGTLKRRRENTIKGDIKETGCKDVERLL
jgi:hypothetical protein